jgi:hypothetical protein
MTGSSLAPVVIAIVVSLGLAIWLVMVYYAASRPFWKHQNEQREPAPTAATGQDARAREPAGTPQRPETGRPAGPGIPHAA